MSAGQNAKNGERPPDDTELPGRPGPTALSLITPAERLEYIAAMVQELKIMSVQANCQALAGLLETAYLEALRQRRARV